MLEDTQTLLKRAEDDIVHLKAQVRELEANKVNQRQFVAMQDELNATMKRMQNAIKEKVASDSKMQAWIQTRLETHKRQITNLIVQDDSKGKQLQIVEEQLAGMDFDMYALNGAGGNCNNVAD